MAKHNLLWNTHNEKLGVTPEEYLREYAYTKSDDEIRKIFRKIGFEVSINTMRRQRERMGLVKNALGQVKESTFSQYVEPPYVLADRVAILPDPQFPYHEANFLNNVLGLCEAWKVNHCILAGDVLENACLTGFDPAWVDGSNFDNESVSDTLAEVLTEFMSDLSEPQKAKLKNIMDTHKGGKSASGAGQEWHEARKALKQVVSYFNKLTWIMGNHEGRILKQLSSPMAPEDLKRLFLGDDPKIKIAPYYYCLVTSAGINWRIIHPKSSGKGDAKIYAAKYLTNIVMAHSHQVMMQKDRSGKFWCVEIGAIVDETRLAYAAQRDNKSDQHLLGALIIRDGFPWLLTEDSPFKSLAKI